MTLLEQIQHILDYNKDAPKYLVIEKSVYDHLKEVATPVLWMN